MFDNPSSHDGGDVKKGAIAGGISDAPKTVTVNGMEIPTGDEGKKTLDSALKYAQQCHQINGYITESPAGQHEVMKIQLMATGMSEAQAEAKADSVYGKISPELKAAAAKLVGFDDGQAKKSDKKFDNRGGDKNKKFNDRNFNDRDKKRGDGDKRKFFKSNNMKSDRNADNKKREAGRELASSR